MSAPLVKVSELSVRLDVSPPTHTVNGVSFELAPGEVLGILGESGSGESVTLKTLLRPIPEHMTAITGAVEVDGQDVLALQGRALADHRGGVASMIFQHPALALDPVYTIGWQTAETVGRREGKRCARGKRGRLRCWSLCAFLPQGGGSRTTPTRCPAARGSGP